MQEQTTGTSPAELDRFIATLDLDIEALDEGDRKAFDESKRTLSKAMDRGQLTINPEGCPVFKSQSGREFTFKKPTGGTLVAMDHQKGPNEKAIAAMADMTGKHRLAFTEMLRSDLRVCETIVVLSFAT